MAATLVCKRLVSRPNLYCSALRHQATHRGRPRKVASEEEKGPFVSMSFNGTFKCGSMTTRFHLNRALDPPSLSSCNYFLEEFLKLPRASPRIAKQFLAQMILLGVIPTVSTFSIIIKCYCQYHKYQDVLDLVGNQSKALEVKLDASFCKALLNAACVYYQPYACHYLLQRLRSTYQGQLPLACYDAIVRRFCPRKPIKDATGLLVLLHELSKMKQLGVYPDEKIYNILLNARKIPGEFDWSEYEMLYKAMMMGRLMFTEGIRIGAVNPTTSYVHVHKGER